jgi:hypothetical protein
MVIVSDPPMIFFAGVFSIDWLLGVEVTGTSLERAPPEGMLLLKHSLLFSPSPKKPQHCRLHHGTLFNRSSNQSRKIACVAARKGKFSYEST